MRIVLPCLLFFISPAKAGEVGVVVEEEGVDLSAPKASQVTAFKKAEYNRIAERMRRMSAKGNQKATNRLFAQLEELGVPLAFAELLIGAQVYRSRGNVAAAYDALKLAARTNGTREVIDWLVAIDEQFGRVDLRVGSSKKQADATRLTSSGGGLLLPDQKAAIAFANKKLVNEGVFQGLLPLGSYRLDGVAFVVQKKGQVQALDLASPK